MKNRKLNRKSGFNYSTPGSYFITTCTKDRVMHFGEISHGELCLNDFGKIADEQMKWLANQYRHLHIHNYVIMPNHVHALIEIINITVAGTGRDFSDAKTFAGTGRDISDAKTFAGTGRDNSDAKTFAGTGRDNFDAKTFAGTGRDNFDAKTFAGTGRDLSLQRHNQKIKSISECIGAYKTTTSKRIHLAGNLDFAWQRSFHDIIVPDAFAFEKIDAYITRNPKNWGK
jgi:putative transposase